MNSNKLTIKDCSLAFIVTFLLCQLGVVTVTIFITLMIKVIAPTFDTVSFLESGVGYLILSVTLYLVMLSSFFFFSKGKENKITNKIKTKKILFYILLAAVSFFCLYPIVTCFDTLLVKCGISLNTLTYSLTTKNYFISIISLVIAPAVCEELLFRGIILSGLKKYGKIFSISMTAFMFCLFHMSLSQTIYPLLMGLLLSVIMYYEENIYYCIAVHLTNNFISLTISYFKINLIFNHWSYIVLAIFLAIVFISTVLVFMIKNHKKNSSNKLLKQDYYFLIPVLTLMTIFWIASNLS